MKKNSPFNNHDRASSGLINKDDINGTGFCTLCAKKSVCKCDRCGDFYCSPVCQRQDWPNHRFICFPMPRLVKAVLWSSKNDNFQEELPKLKLEMESNVVANEESGVNEVRQQCIATIPANGSCVVLVGFKTSNRCSIRSANPSITEEYQKVLKKVDDYGKSSNAFSDIPKINSYALTLKQEKWCRVQIIAVRSKDHFRVYFIDFGTVAEKYLKDLRKISLPISNITCYIHMVKLKDVTHYSYDKKLLQTLSQYINKEYKIQFEELKGCVKLYEWGSTKLLNSIVINLCQKFNGNEKDLELGSTTSSFSNDHDLQDNDLGNGTVKKRENEMKTSVVNMNQQRNANSKRKPITPPRQIQKPCLEPPFELIPLNEKDNNCQIMIVDNSYISSGYIGCLLKKYCDKLSEVTQFLKNHKTTDQPYKPKLNEYCLANFEDDWYRAKVIEILDEDTFQVVYMDFTNEMSLTSKLIRRYPVALTLPCYTTLCAIDGLPENISDEIIDFLEIQCKTFSEIHIDSVRNVSDIHYITSKELLKKLRDAKLL